MTNHFFILLRTIILSLILTLTLSLEKLYSQVFTQTVRGAVICEDSNRPLPGASIVVNNNDTLTGTTSDANGNFRMEDAPVGRYDFEVSYMGYETETVSNLMVTTGKEVILNVSLKPSAEQLSEVEIKAYNRKDQPLNTMASVSARSFTVEETRRYAGGVDDPARMATVFAGVSRGGEIQDNALSIRGNSPKNISWRVEGIDVPNPNHLGGGNVAGGGAFTLLSGQMLSNSDFFTGAFPAEYGNALGGVFDIRMRTGNVEKREHTIQAGLLGIDLSSEGPFVKGGDATYLFNYRYSTFSLLSDAGIIPGDQVPRLQDLSFKFNFPTDNYGTFSLWGVGGLGFNHQPHETDSTEWVTDWNRAKYDWDHNPGATGLNHRYLINNNTTINSTIAASGVYDKWDYTRLDDVLTERRHWDQRTFNSKITLNSFVNHRFNSRLKTRSGFNYHAMFFDMRMNAVIADDLFFGDIDTNTYTNIIDEKGNSSLAEIYTQFQYDLSSSVTINPGLHANYFALNDNYSIEPRMSIEWDFMENHKLSAGYGMHSQLEELEIYFIKKEVDGNEVMPNKDLDFTSAHHFVIAHDWSLGPNMRLKTEPYIQFIQNAPGIADSSYSVINYRQEYGFQQVLENNSRGRNIGVDLTLERFFYDDYYFLFTGSVFDSKYKGDDGKWRNTRYNKGHVLNLLFGKEFFFRDNTWVLGVNGKITHSGGERHAPILKEESIEARRIVVDNTRIFEDQFPSDFYGDISITFRINRQTYSGVWAIQVLNVTANESQRGYYYNMREEELEENTWGFPVPFISYKVEF